MYDLCKILHCLTFSLTRRNVDTPRPPQCNHDLNQVLTLVSQLALEQSFRTINIYVRAHIREAPRVDTNVILWKVMHNCKWKNIPTLLAHRRRMQAAWRSTIHRRTNVATASICTWCIRTVCFASFGVSWPKPVRNRWALAFCGEKLSANETKTYTLPRNAW